MDKKTCPYCGKKFYNNGFSMHKWNCKSPAAQIAELKRRVEVLS
tara:strand:- start:371 stop:502 length:132 start_codon:yes stop_codon:yes gene_type:complete